MYIQEIDQPTFGARIKLGKTSKLIKEDEKGNPIEHLSKNTSIGGSSSAVSTIGSSIISSSNLVETAGISSQVIGSAYGLKSSGIGMSGFVAPVIESSKSVLTPVSVESANAHPSFMSLIAFFTGTFVKNIAKSFIKNPS